MDIDLKNSSKSKQVPEADKKKRLFKERFHDCCHKLSFKGINTLIPSEIIKNY